MHIRHKKILDILLRDGTFSIKRGAVELGVTEMTLRRDLRVLEERKLLLQVRGGATYVPTGYIPGGDSGETAEKLKIAEALFLRIAPVSTLFIGTGHTAFVFASFLARRKNCRPTVVTHSLPVATALFQSGCRVVLLGGELRTTSLDLVGPVAEKNLAEYHVEWLVTGCDGALSEYGFYTSDPNLSTLERRMLAMAEHAAVITTSRKFGKAALTRFAACSDIDLLVTDNRLLPDDAARLAAAGIELIRTE